MTYGYLPTKSQTLRKRVIIRQWEPRLKKGGIRYAEPPALPLLQLSPIAPVPDDSGLPTEQPEAGN